MDSRNRVVAALERRMPDRLPIDLGCPAGSMRDTAYENLKRHLGIRGGGEKVAPDHIVLQFDEEVLQMFEVDLRRVSPPWGGGTISGDAGIQTDAYGVQHRMVGGYFEIVSSPLAGATLADLDNHPWPQGFSAEALKPVAEGARGLFESSSRALVADSIGLGIFEQAWALRGMENLLCDLIADPRFAHALFDKVLESTMRFFDGYLGAVGPYIQMMVLLDDLGGQDSLLMSGEMYSEFIKPRHRQLIDFVKSRTGAKVALHSCGSVAALIPDFIDVGFDVLNPVQVSAHGMDSATLGREFRGQIVFWGGVDEQGVLTNGSPENVRREVACRVEDLGAQGGYIIAPTHSIQDNVPPENIVAMYEAAKEFAPR